MIYLLILVSLALIVIALVTGLNVLLFPRLQRGKIPTQTPLVSLLVPARNEAAVIAQTVQALLAQTYPHFELIVLDDASTDGTGDLARQAGAGDPRLRVIAGVPLPEGWTGKNHACHVLAKHAQGEILLFTDADTRWHPTTLAALIAYMEHSQADLATVWATQTTITWAERLIVPLMMFAILGYLPILMTHYAPFAIFAAANGQCMAWRRTAYERVGGHRAVANNVLDDVTLARLAKAAGLRLRMLDGNGLLACRMYTDWRSVREGYAKNILAGYGNSVIALSLATIFHLLVFIMPLVWLFMPNYSAWGGALLLMGMLIRALTAATSRQRVSDALFLPLSVLLMTIIAAQALYWHFTGGPRWKGRIIRQPTRSAAHG
jgi:chlorobactene glucosyltransferase